MYKKRSVIYFQLAWRNIWRNPRRTIVIMLAVIIGVWSMVFLGALMRGLEVGMIKNGIATLTGNIQIHHQEYRNDPVIDHSITDTREVKAALKQTLPPGARWSFRVRVSAIASNARHSSRVTLVGIDPKHEAAVSFIGQAVTRGRYLGPRDTYGIVVGQALVDMFDTKIGHKLVLMSQASDGEIASKAFRIIGVFRAEMLATEKQFAFVTLPVAQHMLKLNEGISEISIALSNDQDTKRLATALKAKLPSDTYDIDPWWDLLPILNAYLELSDGFVFIWYVVVFISMGFGIINTMLMAVFERIREFGLFKAMGMKPGWIIREVLLESFLLLVIGMVFGNISGLITVLAFSTNGIDLSALAAGAEFAGISRMLYPVIYGMDIAIANLVVLVLGILVSLYPAARAARFTPVEALAHT
jgi:ABC-type lipoprotein release transport system permease subunit